MTGPGAEAAFEEVWTSRDTHLPGVPGFMSFHLLRGPTRDDHVLYSSHTIWRDKAAFEAWTTSEAFRQALRYSRRKIIVARIHRTNGFNQYFQRHVFQ